MSLAPNMVTLIGFMFILANVALLQVMDPGLQGNVSLKATGKELEYER